jgi:hypothetical protein
MASVNLKDKYKDTMSILTGEFDGHVVEPVAGESSNGDPQIKFKVRIEGGPDHGKTFPDNITLSSEGAVRIFFEKLSVMGLGESYFVVPDGQEPPSLEATARDMDGRPVHFELARDPNPWKGRERAIVKSLSAPKSGAVRMPKTSGAPGTPGALGVPNVPNTGTPNVPPPTPAPSAPVPAPPELKLPDGTDLPF